MRNYFFLPIENNLPMGVFIFGASSENIVSFFGFLRIIESDFSDAYKEAKQYILEWIEALGPMPAGVEDQFKSMILTLMNSKFA